MPTFKTRHFNWEICGCCRGNGKVDHPAFSNGFTSEEWQEMRDDVQFDGESSADRYLAGFYDVSCGECGGSGKVRVPNFRAMPRDERRVYIQFLRDERDDAECRRELAAEYEAELRMGA